MSGEVLANALKVLCCFTANNPDWGVTELSECTGLTKGHVCKILRGYVDAGFLTRHNRSRRYRVGSRAFLLGAGFIRSSNLIRRAEPFLRELSQETSLTATLNVSEQSNMLFVMAVDRARSALNSWPAGSYIPLHATAAGKIHAAFCSARDRKTVFVGEKLQKITASTICDPAQLHRQLDETRKTGCSYTFGESTYGIGGIASPIFDDCGHAVGAISLLYPLGRSDQSKSLSSSVKASARRLSHSIGADCYPYL
jgi:DNA-binding IclR family transcriptional regulator